jgi:hypothetical protein
MESIGLLRDIVCYSQHFLKLNMPKSNRDRDTKVLDQSKVASATESFAYSFDDRPCSVLDMSLSK